MRLLDVFHLDPDVVYLNHGSYGSCPRAVFEEYQRWQLELERRPMEILARRFDELLGNVRAELATFVGARADDLVLVPNTTSALNAVIRSLRLGTSDEIVSTGHEYGAIDRTWEFVCARVRRVEPQDVAAAIGPDTRAVSVSHITSPTAVVAPVAEICAAARAAGVLSIVDGAHAPGQVALDLDALGADVYAGNCHKWVCAPKGAAFLWARPEHQAWIAPLVISWGWRPESSFAERHGWQGTRDPSAYLAVPAALAFHRTLELERCRRLAAHAERRLADKGLEPVPGEPAPQMRALALPATTPPDLQEQLLDRYRIEIPVAEWNGRRLLRVSLAPYNDEDDVERLASALTDLLAHGSS